MDNKRISEVFQEMADILEIQGEGFFRVNGYRKGALIVEGLADDLNKLVKEDRTKLDEIPGIGKALSEKIVELVETGKCQAHEKLKEGFPHGLLEMLQLRGLGPKKVKLFNESLGIENVEELEVAAKAGKLRELPKMGEKSEAEILLAIEEHRRFSRGRTRIDVAKRVAEDYLAYLQKFKGIKQLQYAGSLRRMQETIGDIDILATLEEEHGQLMRYFCTYKEVSIVTAEGDTKSSVLLNSGIQVDLRVVPEESFGAALHYFTGSKEHNVAIRDLAKKKGLKVNEYGLFDGESKLAGEDEKGMFEGLGLKFIAPELRQNKGEIEYTIEHKISPEVVAFEDLGGDFRCAAVEELEKIGDIYDEKNLKFAVLVQRSADFGVMFEEKMKMLFSKAKNVGKFQFLKGADVAIGKDGELKASESFLKDLDVIIGSVQVDSRLDEAAQTERVIRALKSKKMDIFGLPTGRIINRREEMKMDMEKVFKAAAEFGVCLEICGDPERLDLSDRLIRMAKELGAKFVISSGLSTTAEIENLDFALGMARRGWLQKSNLHLTAPFR